MVYEVSLMVDEFGYLAGGESAFPVRTVDHDWWQPYPAFDTEPAFSWRPGTAGEQPDVFRHPQIRDWVCDDTAWKVLHENAGDDVRHLGRAWLDGRALHVVQVVAVLDVADPETSVVEDYGSYQVIGWLGIRPEDEAGLRRRVFRIPQAYTDLFVGEEIRDALVQAGVTGLSYLSLAGG